MHLIHTTLVIILFQVVQCVELKDLNWESLKLKSLSEKTLKEYLKNEDLVPDYVGIGGQPKDLRREEKDDKKNGENIFEPQPNSNVPLFNNDARRVLPLLKGYNTHIPLFERRTAYSGPNPLRTDVKSERRKSPGFIDNTGRVQVPHWQSMQTSKLPPHSNDLNLPTKTVIFDTKDNKFNNKPPISYYKFNNRKYPFRKTEGDGIDNTEKNKSEESEEGTQETEEDSYENRTNEDEDEDATEETEEDSSEVLEFPKMKNKNYKEIKKDKLKGKKIRKVCPSNGFFPDLKECNKFYLCLKNEVIHFKCLKKTFIYNPFVQNCIPYFKDTCKNFYCKKKGTRKVAYERDGQYYASCKNEVAKRIHKCPTGYIFVERDQRCENILPSSGTTSKPKRLPTLPPTPEIVAVPFTTNTPHIQRSSIKPNNGVKLSTISVKEFANYSTSYSPTRPATPTESGTHHYGTSKSSASSNPLIPSELTYSPIIHTPTNLPFKGSNISVNTPIDPSITQRISFNDNKNTDENTEPNWTKRIERFNEENNVNIQTTPRSASTSYHKLSSNVKDNFPYETQKYTTQYFQSSSNEKLTVMPKLKVEVSNTVRTPGLLEIQEVFRSNSPTNYISKNPTPKAFDVTSEAMVYSPIETVTLPSIEEDFENLSAITITPNTHISTGSPSVDLVLGREQTASQFEPNNVSKSNDGSTLFSDYTVMKPSVALFDSNDTTQLPLTTSNPTPHGNKTYLFPTTVKEFIMNYLTTIRPTDHNNVIASDTANLSLEQTTVSPDTHNNAIVVDKNPVSAQKISISSANNSTTRIHAPTEVSERSGNDNPRGSSTISKFTDKSPSPNTEPTTSGTEISFSSDSYPSSHVPLNSLALNKSTVAEILGVTEPTDKSSRLSDMNRTYNTEPAVNVHEIPTPSVSIPSCANASLIGSVQNMTSVTEKSGALPRLSTSTNEPKLSPSPITSSTIRNPSSNDASVTEIPGAKSSIPASTHVPRKSVHNNTSNTKQLKHNETSDIPNSTANIVSSTDFSLNDVLHNITEPPTTITDMPAITASIDSVSDISSRDSFHNRTSTTEKPASVIIILATNDFVYGGSANINSNSQLPTSVTETPSTSKSTVEKTFNNKATTASPVFEVGEDTNTNKTVLTTPTSILPYTTISHSATTKNSNLSSNLTFVTPAYEVSNKNSLEPITQKPTTTEAKSVYLSTISSTKIPVVESTSFTSNDDVSTPTSFQSYHESKYPSTNPINASDINVNLTKTENTQNVSYIYSIPSETESSTRSFSTVIHATYVAANTKTSTNPIIQQTTESVIRKNSTEPTSTEYLDKNQTNNSVESPVSNLNSSQTTTDSVFERTSAHRDNFQPEMNTSYTVQYNRDNSTSNNLAVNLTDETSNGVKYITKPQGHISIATTEKIYTTKEKTIANINFTEYNSTKSNYSLTQQSTNPIQTTIGEKNSTEQLITNNSSTTPSMKQSILNNTIDDVNTARDSLGINTGSSTSPTTLLLNMTTHQATDLTHTREPNVTFPSYGKTGIYRSSTISPNTQQYLENNTMVTFELPSSTEQNPASNATTIMTDGAPITTTTHLPPTAAQNSNSSSTNDQIYGSVQQVDVLTTLSAAPTFVVSDSEIPITNQTATENSFSNFSPSPIVSFSTENKVQDSSIHVDLLSSTIIPNVQTSTDSDLPLKSSIKTNSSITSRIIANTTGETKITSVDYTENAMTSESPLTNLKTVGYNNSSPSSDVLYEPSKILPDSIKSSESFLINPTSSKTTSDILSTMSSVIDNSSNIPLEVSSQSTEVNKMAFSSYTTPTPLISKVPNTNTTDRETSRTQIHRTTRDTSKLSTQTTTAEDNLSLHEHKGALEIPTAGMAEIDGPTKNSLQSSSETMNETRTTLTINPLATNVTVADDLDYITLPSAITEINEQSSTVALNSIQFSTELSHSTEAPSVNNSVLYTTDLSEENPMASINNSTDKTTITDHRSTTTSPNPTEVASFDSTVRSSTAQSYSTEYSFVNKNYHNVSEFTTMPSVSSTDNHNKVLTESSTGQEAYKHLSSTTSTQHTPDVVSYSSREQETSTESHSTNTAPFTKRVFNNTDSPMISSDSTNGNSNTSSTKLNSHSESLRQNSTNVDSFPDTIPSSTDASRESFPLNSTISFTVLNNSTSVHEYNDSTKHTSTTEKQVSLQKSTVLSNILTTNPPITSSHDPNLLYSTLNDQDDMKSTVEHKDIPTSKIYSSSTTPINEIVKEHSDSTTSGPKEQTLYSNTVQSKTPTTNAPNSFENLSHSTNSTVDFTVNKNGTFDSTTSSPSHSSSISAIDEKSNEYVTSESTTSEPKEQTLYSNTVQSQTPTTNAPNILENLSHSTNSTVDFTVIKNDTFASTTSSPSHSSSISAIDEKSKEYVTSDSKTSGPKEQTLYSNTVQSQTPTTNAPNSLENLSHSTNSTVDFTVINNNTFASTTSRPSHSSSISAIDDKSKEYVTSDSTTSEPKEQTLYSNTVQSQTPTTNAPNSFENLSHSTNSTVDFTVNKNGTFASTTSSPSHSSSISAIDVKSKEYVTSDSKTSGPKEQTLYSNTVQSQTPTTNAPNILENLSHSTNRTVDFTVINNNTFASTTSRPSHSSSISAIVDKSKEYVTSDSTTSEPKEQTLYSNTVQSQTPTTNAPNSFENLSHSTNSTVDFTVIKNDTFASTTSSPSHSSSVSAIDEKSKEYLTSDSTTSEPKEQTLYSNTVQSQTPTTNAPNILENLSHSTNSTVDFTVIKNNTFASTTSSPSHSSSVSAIDEKSKEYLTSDSTTSEPKERTLYSNTVQSQTPTTNAPNSLENLSHSTNSTVDFTVNKNGTFASTTSSPSHSFSISAIDVKSKEYVTSDSTTSGPKEQTLYSNTVQSHTPTTNAPNSLENLSHSTNSTVDFTVIKNDTFASTTSSPSHSSSVSAIDEKSKEYLTSDSTTSEPKERTLYSNTVHSQTPTTNAPNSLENLSHSTNSTVDFTVIKNNTFASTTSSPSHSSSVSAIDEKSKEYLTSDSTTSEPKERTLYSNTVHSQTPTTNAPTNLENLSHSTNSTVDFTVIKNNTFLTTTTSSPSHSSSLSAINEKSKEYLTSDSTTITSFEQAQHSSAIYHNLITPDEPVTVANLDNSSNPNAYNTIDQLKELNFTNIQDKHNTTYSVISTTPTFTESNTTRNFQDFTNSTNNSIDNTKNSTNSSTMSTIEFSSAENLILSSTTFSISNKPSDQESTLNVIPVLYSTESPSTTTLISGISPVEIPNKSTTIIVESKTQESTTSSIEKPISAKESNSSTNTSQTLTNNSPNTNGSHFGTTEIVNNPTVTVTTSPPPVSTYVTPVSLQDSSLVSAHEDISGPTTNLGLNNRYSSEDLDQIINHTTRQDSVSSSSIPENTTDRALISSQNVTNVTSTALVPDDILTFSHDGTNSIEFISGNSDSTISMTTYDPSTTTMESTTSGATPSTTTNKADEVLNVLLDSLNFFFL